jgi:hypothetical protein
MRARQLVARLLCLFRGHRPGSERFRYANVPRVLAHRPDLRGPVRIEMLGRECDRCLRPIEEAPR